MFISPYGLIHILLRDDYYGLAALAASCWLLKQPVYELYWLKQIVYYIARGSYDCSFCSGTRLVGYLF